jgi:hypothetical protein
MEFHLDDAVAAVVGPPGDHPDLMPLPVAEEKEVRGRIGTVVGGTAGGVLRAGYLEDRAQARVTRRQNRSLSGARAGPPPSC